MRCSPTFNRWVLSAALAAALTLVLAAGALAASPIAGRLYTGYVAKTVYHEFTAPVSFTVSKNGRQLLGFKWAGGGCTGLGGPGNAWTSSYLNYKVGTINVLPNGAFSVRNVKSTNIQNHVAKVTISTITGRFKTKTTSTGTISFTQKLAKTCSGTATFTATLGPLPGSLHKKSPGNAATGQSTAPTLSWSPSRNATGYQYCVDTSNNDTCNSSWVSTRTSTHATLSGLKAGTSYYWQVKASSAHGTVAADNAAWYTFTVSGGTVKPQAGSWRATSLTGPVSGNGPGGSVTATGLFFNVASGQLTVSAFGFSYEYSGPVKVMPYSGPCSGSGDSAESAPSPISNREFSTPGATGPWTGGASGTFHGTFDSPTTAHGTAQMSAYVGGSGCFMSGTTYTGTFSWTASRQG